MNHRADTLAASLGDSDLARRLDALSKLAEEPPTSLSESAIENLVGCLGDDNKAIQRRTAGAIAALAPANQSLLLQVRRELKSSNRQARWGAAYALGSVDGALALDCADALLEALGDRDSDVRWAAAELLGRLSKRDTDAIADRLVKLANSGSPIERRMVIYSLRDYASARPELLPVLERAARDHDIHLRLAAVSALAKLYAKNSADGEAATILLRNLHEDENLGVRRAAAAALGQLGVASDSVKAALERCAAQTADLSLARAAETALSSLEQGNAAAR